MAQSNTSSEEDDAMPPTLVLPPAILEHFQELQDAIAGTDAINTNTAQQGDRTKIPSLRHTCHRAPSRLWPWPSTASLSSHRDGNPSLALRPQPLQIPPRAGQVPARGAGR